MMADTTSGIDPRYGHLPENSAPDLGAESEGEPGRARAGEGTDTRVESEQVPGALAGRYIDAETARLRMFAMTWRDLQQTRKALAQRGLPESITEEFARPERRVGRQLTQELRRHPLWPWLAQFPGLGGGHTAIVIAAIGDPRRFPGQQCTIGHYHPHPPGLEVGSRCPLTDREGGRCPGLMLPPRTTTGVRSVWHYLGLHCDENGRSPRKTRGQRVSWNPTARASVLQPDGIADQIVRLRVPVYRELYDAKKDRLARERGADRTGESEGTSGSAPAGGNAAERLSASVSLCGGVGAEEPDVNGASEIPHGLFRPFQIDRTARKVAAKEFIGDLLIAWKQLANTGAEARRREHVTNR